MSWAMITYEDITKYISIVISTAEFVGFIIFVQLLNLT